MILIAGIPTEEPVACVIESAEKLNIEYAIFNQREAHFYDILHSNHENKLISKLSICGRHIDLSEISGIYFRMMDAQTLPENTQKGLFRLSDDKLAKLNFINQVFCNLCDTLPVRVFNRPKDMASNFSKLYQLSYIKQVGLGIPESLISNSVERVKDFYQEKGAIIYKSVSSIRSIVKKLDDNSLNRIESIKCLPTQFQECLEGNNIRVHIVGDDCLAAFIESGVVDYRYSGSEDSYTDMTPFELPKNIEEKCFELSKLLNLPFCGIDLFKTHSGDYYCFEVNPSPGYSFFQSQANLPISDAIVKFLEYGTTTTPATNANDRELVCC